MKHSLNAEQLLCPMPVIKCQNLAKQCQPGDVIELSATDPGVLADIPAWSRMYHHVILDQHEQDDVFYFTIEIGTE